MSEVSEKNWNEQLHEWYRSSGKSMAQIKKQTGIPRATFGDYVHGRISDLDRMAPERLRALYNLTGLECFRHESPRIEMSEPEKRAERQVRDKSTRKRRQDYNLGGAGEISNAAREGKRSIEMIVEAITSQLKGNQRLEAGLLRAQQYRPTVQQRTDAIMELLDVLGEEVDYFRTAPKEEKEVLIERLQNEPESFSYATQMLNIIYSGKKIDSWMLMAQPPSRIKRLTKKDE